MIMLPTMQRNSWLPDAFDDFFNTDFMPRANATAPAINVIEKNKKYVVELAAPGLKKDDFTVTVDADGNLKVRMEKKQNNEEKNEKAHYLRREFADSQYEQTLVLPEDVERDSISAKVENGVLYIELPKVGQDEQKVQREIKVG